MWLSWPCCKFGWTFTRVSRTLALHQALCGSTNRQVGGTWFKEQLNFSTHNRTFQESDCESIVLMKIIRFVQVFSFITSNMEVNAWRKFVQWLICISKFIIIWTISKRSTGKKRRTADSAINYEWLVWFILLGQKWPFHKHVVIMKKYPAKIFTFLIFNISKASI